MVTLRQATRSFLGETSKTAVSHCAVTNKRRDVLTKQVKAGQETVVATEPNKRDGGSRDLINVQPSYDLEARVLLDTSSLPTTSQLSLVGALRRWYWCSVLRLLLAEFCSLPHRIAVALEMRAWELRGYRGLCRTGFASALVPQSQRCRRAYIRYMQQLQTDRPALTIFDRLLAENAWKAGSVWDVRSDTLQSQIHCSSAYPDGSNSMPLPAVPQSTTHDPQARLPSRE